MMLDADVRKGVGVGVDQMRTPADRGVGKAVIFCGRPLWTTPKGKLLELIQF